MTYDLHFLLEDTKITEQVKEMQQSPTIGDFFEKANKTASDIYLSNENPKLIEITTQMEKDLDREQIKNVVLFHNYSGIDPIAPEHDKYLAIGSFKEQLVRLFVGEIVKNRQNAFPLSETEKQVLLYSCEVMQHYDELYRKWHIQIVSSPLAKRLKAMGPSDAKRFLTKEGALTLDISTKYLYVIFEEDGNNRITAKSYAEAFPEEIKGIIEQTDALLGKLTVDDDETKALALYFDALKSALSSTNTREHDSLWAYVDKIYMNVSGRMQPVHMMESYVDFLGLRVEPEFMISFRDDRFKDINMMMDQTKTRLINYLSREFEGKNSLKASIAPMEKSIAGIFTVISSGRQLDFRRAGQNVPNREDIRLINGVKIFIDMKTMGLRWEMQKVRLSRLLGQDFLTEQFSNELKIIAVTAGAFIAGHEVGHNAFILESLRQKIGSNIYKDIEENKADLCAVCTAAEYLPYDEQCLLVKGLLGSSLQNLVNKSNLSKKPYFNCALVTLQSMQKSEILTEAQDVWKFDLNKEKLDTFFSVERQIFNEIIEVYDQESLNLAKQYIDIYYQETEFIKKIEKKLGIE